MSTEGRTLVILGAGGDLTARLLLPGIGTYLAAARVDDLLVLGSDRDDWDDARWRELVAESFRRADAGGPAPEAAARRARYVRADATSADDLRRVLEASEGQPVLYFALPPAVTEQACRALAEVELPPDADLVLEKPFGSDVASAQALNTLLAALVSEDHVHRIDHFLGMGTVLNILGIRFANRILEPVLTAEHVDGVDVAFDETLGLEGRAGYYDGAGALVDMIQSHLLQVLAFVAMEPPGDLSAEAVRDRKAEVLRATRLWNGDAAASSYRARYTAGEIDGRRLPGYADEEGVDPGRGTETLAELVLEVRTQRWAGVPFRVRSGKAIGTPRQEVAVTFKDPARIPSGLGGYERPARLRLGLGAGRIELDLNISGEGDPFTIEPITLAGGFGRPALLEYGEVIKSVLEGSPPLSIRADTSVESWRIVDPVRDAWRRGDVPLEEYAAGSDGPEGWPSGGRPSARRA